MVSTLTLEKLLDAKKLLDAAEVPDQNRIAYVPSFKCPKCHNYGIYIIAAMMNKVKIHCTWGCGEYELEEG